MACEQNDRGQIVSVWGETGSQRTSLGRKCLLIICVGVSACRQMREGGGDVHEDETHLSPSNGDGTHRGAENNGARRKVTGCARAQ